MRKPLKLDPKALFIVVALILFLVPGISAIYSGVNHAIVRSRSSVNISHNVVYSEEYPFKGSVANTKTNNTSSLSNKYLYFTNRLTEYIDSYSGKYNNISSYYFGVYGRTMKAIGKDYIEDHEDPVIRLGNGYLTYVYPDSNESVKYEGVLDFSRWLKEKDIPFLFILPADKSDERYAVYPNGFPKGYSDFEEEYLKYLADNGISYLNSREILVAENKDFYSWFYKTDHHWNAHAGFSIASATAKRLKTEYNLPVDTSVLNKSDFDIVTYKNVFLGSQGRKVTLIYASPENFEVYYPRFVTSFTIAIPTKRLDLTGSLEQILINSEALYETNFYSNDTYLAFLYGNLPLIRIHNLNNKNGTRALMIKTSDANVVDTYLALTVEYLDIIDPRFFDGSIRTFIEKTHPDIVLTCAYPSDVLDDKMRDIR